jgi:hypothetical protein
VVLAESGFQEVVNFVFSPSIIFVASVGMLALFLFFRRTLSRPVVSTFGLFVFIGGYIWLCTQITDADGRLIALFPDNVPITMMLFSVFFLVWLATRRAVLNDERTARGEPLLEEGSDDKVLCWPDLVYTELLCMVIATVGLIVWSILLKAPLEPPANPMDIPNPSKAPWYFLGLQELLVYYDPWIAGVLLPGLIIVGLIAIPYIDRNPKGNGYYTFRERPLAITLFHFGFIILWVVLIVLGTFLRGPNWNFFAPGHPWDPHKSMALLNINISDIFWIKMLGTGLPTRPVAIVPGLELPHYLIRELPGMILVGIYLLVIPVILAKTVFKRLYREMGFIRFVVFIMLFMITLAVPIKMVGRWLFNLKYVVAITEWFFNI